MLKLMVPENNTDLNQDSVQNNDSATQNTASSEVNSLLKDTDNNVSETIAPQDTPLPAEEPSSPDPEPTHDPEVSNPEIVESDSPASSTEVSNEPVKETSTNDPSVNPSSDGPQFNPETSSNGNLSASVQDSGIKPEITKNVVKGKKSHLKLILVIFLLIILFAGGMYGAYTYGKGKKVIATVAAPKPITLPPQAIVTSACTVGRGKQYIIPADIPQGPIYDVVNNKVIAIEYVIGIQQLLTNSDSFSNTILYLTKNYPVDHFTVIPVPSQAGQTDETIHLIMFVVPKSVSNSITCGQTPSSTSTSSGSTSTTGSGSSTSTGTSSGTSTGTTPTTSTGSSSTKS